MQKGMPTLEAGRETDLVYHLKVVHEIVGELRDGRIIQKYVRDALDGAHHSFLLLQAKITEFAKTYEPPASPTPLWMKPREGAGAEEEDGEVKKEEKEIKEEEEQ